MRAASLAIDPCICKRSLSPVRLELSVRISLNTGRSGKYYKEPSAIVLILFHCVAPGKISCHTYNVFGNFHGFRLSRFP